MSVSRVDLGFIDKTESWLLQSNFFPSKIGGKPAWLDLKQLPNSEELKCKNCSKPLIFLGQVYAPIDDDPNCFHRTLFLFICRNEACCIRNNNNNLVVFRSQLPKENVYYPSEPPDETRKSEFSIEEFVKICALCGCSADKHCSKCKSTSYCSREHQLLDWKSGHKVICGKDSLQSSNNANSSVLFEEFELVIEDENENKNMVTESSEEIEKRNLEEFENLKSKGQLGTMQDCPDEEFETFTSESNVDKTFLQFRKKIAEVQGQVLRYNKGGEPIWIANDPILEEIPNCENCGSERQFEFQILPSLLYLMHENSLDWGVLCIYTCKKNCSGDKSYIKEFVFKQDVTLTDI